MPDKLLVIPIDLAVSYDSDLEKVEKVTLEVAQESIKSFLKGEKFIDYIPFICYNKFDYFSINFTVYLKIREEEFFEHLKLKHQFLKKLHEQYKSQDINIPFPFKLAYFTKQNNFIESDEDDNSEK